MSMLRRLRSCQQSVSNQTDSSLALARHASLNDAKQSNLVFSPLSLNVMVSLIAAGASGPTLQQLLSFLNSESIDDVNTLSSELVSSVLTDGSSVGGPKLNVANSVWIQEGLPLKPSFKHVLQNSYKADSFRVDFRSGTNEREIMCEINSWAEKKTNGLIKQVVAPGSVNALTRIILFSALYFKGEWSQKFDPSRTKEDVFHLLGGASVKVPFISSSEEQYISTFDGFKVLRLPYKNGGDERHFSMYIFLPDSKDGLPALVEKVGSESGFLSRHKPCYDTVEVNKFRLPKFKYSFRFEASMALRKLGTSLAFTDGNGGLTEMVDSPTESELLHVSEIYHTAIIEVNEEGSEAATASLLALRGCSRFPPPKVDFVADHPFMFLIQEDITGAVLFFGHVLNPLQK